MGFSAGGHLASELGVSFDAGNPGDADPVEQVSSRPDFMILAYPVIAPTGPGATSSFQHILGETPDPQTVELLSTDLHVTAQTPPAFLVCADDDQTVSSESAVRFYLALHRSGVPAEIHIFERGKHAFSMAVNNPFVGTWTMHLFDWLRINGFVERDPR
jgi:acetyl esterase/lipase